MELVQLTKEEFRVFSEARDDYNIWQSVDMAEMREIAGFPCEFVGLKRDGELAAAGMLSYRTVMGFRQYYAPRGFLVDFNDHELLTCFLTEVKKYCKKHHALSIRFDPYIPYKERNLDGELVEGGFDNSAIVETILKCGYQHHGFTRGIDLSRECRWMYTIPLKGHTEESLLASFERNARRSVQRTIKYRIYTKELDESNVDEFIRVAVATGERRGFEVRTPEYYRNLLKHFGSRGHAMFLSAVINMDYYLESIRADAAEEQKVIDDCNVKLARNPDSVKINKRKKISEDVLASYDKRIEEALKIQKEKGNEIALSSSVFFVNKNEIMCLLAGVYEEYKQFASPFALHWQMMKYGIEHGIGRYNLYGISGIFDESADDYGVYLFKKEFNGEVVELIGEFEASCSFMNGIYKTLSRIKNRKASNE